MAREPKMQKDRRRSNLFDLDGANLALYAPEHNGDSGCPICARTFNHIALDQPLLVDIAHVFPKACGGRLETLTCCDCNSRIGTMYDEELKQQFAVWRASVGASTEKVKARIHFDGMTIGAVVSRPDGKLHIEADYRHAPPKAMELLAQRGYVGEFKLTMRWLNPVKVRAGLLHSRTSACSARTATSTSSARTLRG